MTAFAGFKVYAVSCAATGFCLAFIVHTWLPEDRALPSFRAAFPHCQSVVDIVVYLVSCAVRTAATAVGYIVVTDRWFTSMSLLRALVRLGHHLVGTVTPKKSGVPQRLFWSPKSSQRVRASARFARSTHESVLLQQWQDRGMVAVLSDLFVGVRGSPDQLRGNKDCPYTTKRKVCVSAAESAYERREFPVPPATLCFQTWMRGVDRNDQLRQECSTRLQCRRWYMAIFFFVFDLCITNALVLYRLSHPDRAKCSVLDFRVSLVQGLLEAAAQCREQDDEDADSDYVPGNGDDTDDNGDHDVDSSGNSAGIGPAGAGGPSPRRRQRTSSGDDSVRTTVPQHLPKSEPGGRHRCAYCREQHRSGFLRCTTCDVLLCCRGSNQCYLLFHGGSPSSP